MPLKLPNLDDRRYKDLVEEARSLIPTHAPEWTNHNPSDPGITLIELFASLTEVMLYRLNRVTDENRKKFLKLLNGPDWSPTEDLAGETRRAVRGIREVYRAVTCGDYELLATDRFNAWLDEMRQREQNGDPIDEWWQTTRLDPAAAENLPSNVSTIARARCVPRRYLGAGTESGRLEEKPGHLSVIIVPAGGWAGALGPQPSAAQRLAVWAYLDERRTLTTRHHVVGPLYAPVEIEAVIARRSDVPTETVLDGVTNRLKAFFNPLPDEENDGWPFGRDVYVSEVCDALEKVEGVDYVPDLLLASACDPAEEACVAAEDLWHDEGDQIGLRVAAHQLPAFRDVTAGIVIVPPSQILVIHVEVDAVLSPGADRAAAKRGLKQAVRRFFHPRHDGPREDAVADVKLLTVDLHTALSAAASALKIGTVSAAGMRADSSRCEYSGKDVVSVTVKAGEIVDLRLKLSV